MSAFVRNGIIAMAVSASVSTQAAYAGCVLEYSVVARARFVRCESAQFYWDAAGGDSALYEAVERELAQSDPGTRELRRQRMMQDFRGGPLGPDAKYVAILHVDWQVMTTPWQPPYAGTVELKGEPQQLGLTLRYVWHGPPETCETPPIPGASMDLWVHGPCCDTVIPGEDGCFLAMSYAEPAPAPLREVLVKALDDR